MIKIKHLWVHLLIIFLVVGYFFAAPRIYVRYFKEFGKPVLYSGVLPKAENKLIISPFVLRQTWIEDEDVYQLDGWGFAVNLEKGTQRFLVLENGNSRYFFPIQGYVREDLKNIFGPDAHVNAGLRINIAKNVLPFGQYRIGAFFDGDQSDLFVRTNQELIFKANQVSLGQYDGLFDEINLIEGTQVSLSGEPSSSLTYNFEELVFAESFHQQCIRLSGYVFSETIYDQQPLSVSLLLNTTDDTLEFPTTFFPRPDVPIWFKRLDIGNPGFLGCIPTTKLSDKNAKIGFRVVYSEEEYYQWTSLSLWHDQGKYFSNKGEIRTP